MKQKREGTLVRGGAGGGQLTEESQQGVQSLAGQVGLQAPPITPAGTAAIGGNPDQQKMAGTPAQKTAALNLSQQNPTSLQDTLRRGQVRNQATSEEAASMQKSQDMKNLGSVGERVSDFIDSQRQQLAAQQAPVAVGVSSTATGNASAPISADASNLLNQLRSDPTNQQLQLQVNQALGYDVNTQLSPDQINNLYQSSQQSISAGGANVVADKLAVSDLISNPKFGYSADQLSQLLGVPADQIGKMSVADLRDAINQESQKEFTSTQQLDQKAQSGQLGIAERGLARQAGQEASRVGTRSSEADVAHLDQQIANADQVQFGGKSYNVDDLLKDDTISGVITDYMNAAPGSDTRAQLEKSEPQLVGFIQKNEALLDDASKQLSAGAQTFQDTQQFNKQLAQSLPPELAKVLTPEAGSLQAGKIDVTKHPLLNWLQNNPDAKNKLQGVSSEDAQALSGLNEDQINSLQIGTQGGLWDQYLEQQKNVATKKSVLQQAGNKPDAVVDTALNGFAGGYDQLTRLYNKDNRANLLGLPNTLDQFSDLTHDGKLSSPDQIAQDYSSRLHYSLQDALAHKDPTAQSLKKPGDNTDSWNQDQQTLYNKLYGAVQSGKLGMNDLQDSKISADLAKQLYNSPLYKQGGETRTNVDHYIAGKTIDDIEGKYDGETDVDKLQKEYDELESQEGKLPEAKQQGWFQGELNSLAQKIGNQKKSIEDNNKQYTSAAGTIADSEAMNTYNKITQKVQPRDLEKQIDQMAKQGYTRNQAIMKIGTIYG